MEGEAMTFKAFKRRWRAGKLIGTRVAPSLKYAARAYADSHPKRDDLAELRECAKAWLLRKGCRPYKTYMDDVTRAVRGEV